MVEFYLILAAIGKANSGMFWRLLLGSVVMLVGGYLGEAGYINATLGFIIGCLLYTSPSPRDRQKSRMPSSA